MYMPHFAYPSVSGHLGCFQVFDIMNDAVVNMGIHTSLKTVLLIFLDICQKWNIARAYGNSI